MVLVSIFSTASISIHALLAESDRQKQPVRHPAQISIHALLAESDQDIMVETDKDIKFLSTLSLRRATNASAVLQRVFTISIHALLAESDVGDNMILKAC